MVGVEVIRRAVAIKRLPLSLNIELALQPHRHALRQNIQDEPVHHCDQIDKALDQQDVSDVCEPYPVQAIDQQTTSKILINLVLRVAPAGVRLLVDCLEPHQSHPPMNEFAIYRPVIPVQNRPLPCHGSGWHAPYTGSTVPRLSLLANRRQHQPRLGGCAMLLVRIRHFLPDAQGSFRGRTLS